MIISDESVFLSLLIGVILGMFLVINKIISSGNRKKGIIVFLSDFTFTALFFVLSFIGAVAINKGRIRFLQLGLELIGLLAFYYGLGDPFYKLIVLISNKIRGIIRKIVKKSHKKKKKDKKNNKSTKKIKKLS